MIGERAPLRLALRAHDRFHPGPATLPPGQRIYAIGDIHGCLDRLEAHARR